MGIQVTILTPERQLPASDADAVTLPAHDGSMGILPRHAPMVCRLGEGELHLHREGRADDAYALKGGIARVENDTVTVLADSVVDVAEVSESKLLERLQALDQAVYESSAELAQARAEAYWLVTQLECAGNQVPELQQLR